MTEFTITPTDNGPNVVQGTFRVVDVEEKKVPTEGPGTNPLGIQIKVRLEEVPV